MNSENPGPLPRSLQLSTCWSLAGVPESRGPCVPSIHPLPGTRWPLLGSGCWVLGLTEQILALNGASPAYRKCHVASQGK